MGLEAVIGSAFSSEVTLAATRASEGPQPTASTAITGNARPSDVRGGSLMPVILPSNRRSSAPARRGWRASLHVIFDGDHSGRGTCQLQGTSPLLLIRLVAHERDRGVERAHVDRNPANERIRRQRCPDVLYHLCPNADVTRDICDAF